MVLLLPAAADGRRGGGGRIMAGIGWSLTQMRRLLQHPVRGGLVFLSAAALLVAAVLWQPAPVTGQATDALPKADKLEQKNYTETVPESKVKFDMVAVPGGTFLMGSP